MSLNHKEKVWCKRFQQMMREKPKGLEVHVGQNNILILRKGTVLEAMDEDIGILHNLLDERALFSITADIYGADSST